MHLATNVYPWHTFYQREGRDFGASLDAGLREVREAGLDGFEPILNAPADVDVLGPLLRQHGLQMRSFYVNSTLHEQAQADATISQVVAIAERARTIGARIVVTNPNPIRWGGPEDKSDRQLTTQAAAMNRLGGELRRLGMTLAYHYHDVEFRRAAREMHHMLVGTDPRLVTLCLDAHWTYRGSGDSAVFVFDMLELYADRVTELHLRQSTAGVWTEAFGEAGDIDYARLAARLARERRRVHVVLEQAVEAGTPRTMSALEAHRRGAEAARRVFASVATR
ncbi:MAG TPA: sugar phosphate isomerase/epimerase [Chthonomonadales bacterium]|nr:sugar phosphate isomerase/epimerase [Chthonomonadales bacterium]